MNTTQLRMAVIFNEWARRYAENPGEFGAILNADGKPVEDYGQRCAIYFDDIAKDMDAKGLLPNPGKAWQMPASRHSVKECSEAFEWLRIEATREGAPPQAGVALDEWHAMTLAIEQLHAGYKGDIITCSLVLNEVAAERSRQNQKWGGTKNDDQWNALDWHEMIADYNAWARRMACMGSTDKARRRYVQLAALAVAAVEAIDRKIELAS